MTLREFWGTPLGFFNKDNLLVETGLTLYRHKNDLSPEKGVASWESWNGLPQPIYTENTTMYHFHNQKLN